MAYQPGQKNPPKLEERLAVFHAMKSEGTGRKPTDKWVKMQSGKNTMFHQPGAPSAERSFQPRIKFRRMRMKPDGKFVPA